MNSRVDERRIRALNDKPIKKGAVIYWMSRDQRIQDNWALIYAQDLALELKTPLIVTFCLAPSFLGATGSHYRFMLRGLSEIKSKLAKYQINFAILSGKPEESITLFCNKKRAGALVADFSPLRINKFWKERAAKNINSAFFEVDAHNIIPCWIASPKQEYAAYTFRPKVKKLLPEFLSDFPRLLKHPYPFDNQLPNVTPAEAEKTLDINLAPAADIAFIPGENAAFTAMKLFIESKLAGYEADRNDPTKKGQSGLSPYLHFGQLSAQRLAYWVRQAEAPGIYTDSFLEELIVRRELSDNFCHYNKNYDSLESFPRWASETLAEHSDDPRDYIYSTDEFESAFTHDRLWNAAQKEMVITGKMHGYMRMYWAKKILEWSENPGSALKSAIYLNDKYSIDGRDPNGYAGIAWSIGGVHDRAWFQRPVFGKIRFMSYNGSKSKFNVEKYIDNIAALNKEEK